MAREEWQRIVADGVPKSGSVFKDFILGLFSLFMPVRAPGASLSLPGDRRVFR